VESLRAAPRLARASIVVKVEMPAIDESTHSEFASIIVDRAALDLHQRLVIAIGEFRGCHFFGAFAASGRPVFDSARPVGEASAVCCFRSDFAAVVFCAGPSPGDTPLDCKPSCVFVTAAAEPGSLVAAAGVSECAVAVYVSLESLLGDWLGVRLEPFDFDDPHVAEETAFCGSGRVSVTPAGSPAGRPSGTPPSELAAAARACGDGSG
jgi:hypothetical protein